MMEIRAAIFTNQDCKYPMDVQVSVCKKYAEVNNIRIVLTADDYMPLLNYARLGKIDFVLSIDYNTALLNDLRNAILMHSLEEFGVQLLSATEYLEDVADVKKAYEEQRTNWTLFMSKE